jgi:hypothetical protein
MRGLAAAAVVFVVGCSDSADPNRFYPPPDRAQQALHAALAAWQRGTSPGPVPGTTNPVVQVIDSRRPPGRRLTSFSVLGLAPGDGPREFTVRLVFDDSPDSIRARYVVFGIDPVWVYRHEDYELMTHWDHPMPAK